jgi:hypothetical protein
MATGPKTFRKKYSGFFPLKVFLRHPLMEARGSGSDGTGKI